MRSVSNNNGTKDNKIISYLSAVKDQDKNNNCGNALKWPNNNNNSSINNKNKSNSNDEDNNKTMTAERNKDKDERKNVVRSLSTTATFPKPAPRTRVPSASIAPPSLAHHSTYENLQQLMNGHDSIGDKKVRNGVDRIRPPTVNRRAFYTLCENFN